MALLKILNKLYAFPESITCPADEPMLAFGASEVGVLPLDGLFFFLSLTSSVESNNHPGLENNQGNQLVMLQTMSDFSRM